MTKKTRFEVFKRDGFKCVYCGACAPEAVLVVDHIDPLSKGGPEDILNYATACQPCNAGKSDRTLSDKTAVAKQRAQLDDLAVRREQLEMMLEWRDGLKANQDIELDAAAEAWEGHVGGLYLNEIGRKELKRHIKKYGVSEVLEALEVAADTYVRTDASGVIDRDSVEHAWKKVGGILALRAMPPDERRLYYVQGILRKRLRYVAPNAVPLMRDALQAGVSIKVIEEEARLTRNWTEFSQWLFAADGE